MQAIMESIFDIAYLVTIITMGLLMVCRPMGTHRWRLFGITALILGGGDAFHLVPRMIGLLTDTMHAQTAALGFGKLVTSITMTVFYVMLYHYWCGRYRKPVKSALTICVYALAVCRIALCLLPQNEWLSADAPLRWGIYRNIPFAVFGAVVVVLFFVEATRAADKPFHFAWLAILLSFLFYIPVVLWADGIPAMGMLMIPKTICYVWLVTMGFKEFRKAQRTL